MRADGVALMSVSTPSACGSKAHGAKADGRMAYVGLIYNPQRA